MTCRSLLHQLSFQLLRSQTHLTLSMMCQVTHAFPAVLEKLELHAFDMCKIIDSFVRYEPNTPRDLKRHLHSIEEKIVESLAWERGSSLHPLLVAACENQENQEKEADPMKGLPMLLIQTHWPSIVVTVLGVQNLQRPRSMCFSLSSLLTFICWKISLLVVKSHVLVHGLLASGVCSGLGCRG